MIPRISLALSRWFEDFLCGPAGAEAVTGERWVEVKFRGLLAADKVDALRSLDVRSVAAAVAAPFGFSVIDGVSAVLVEDAS